MNENVTVGLVVAVVIMVSAGGPVPAGHRKGLRPFISYRVRTATAGRPDPLHKSSDLYTNNTGKADIPFPSYIQPTGSGMTPIKTIMRMTIAVNFSYIKTCPACPMEHGPAHAGSFPGSAGGDLSTVRFDRLKTPSPRVFRQ